MNQNKAMVGLSTYESFIEFADDDGSSLNYSVDHPIRFGEPNKTTVFLFRFNAQSIFCLICVDALWVSNAIADEVRHRISKERHYRCPKCRQPLFNLKEKRVWLSAKVTSDYWMQEII